MKRFFAAAAAGCILLSGVLPMCACKQKEMGEPFGYAALYTNERTQPYEETDRLTSRSRYGYTCAHEQGFQGWSYLYGKGGSFAEMTWNAASECWEGGGASMQGERLSPAGETAAVRLYNSPRAGEAVLYGNYKCADASDSGAHIAILVDGEPVYEGELSAGDIIGRYCELSVVLREGSEVAFVVSGDGDVLFDPAVTLEEAQNASLYHLTASGKQYGDVFPYYDEEQHRLYMGFLWSDNAALADNYHDALEVSDNMLTFTDVPEANNYEVWQYYREHYRLNQIFDVSRFCDRSVYSFGVRDNMLYYDEENGRYLMVAGCYYAFDAAAQTSDLVIYASDDEMGLSWTQPGNVVEAGYSRNLPECPSLMKIGDRWYVFVSVAYNTAHQVGPLQYWTGDEGVDCMDVDWSEKEFAFLDGEDLCAARPTQVGEKVYLWGWIPSTYDRMPWAPWAGHLNLPREVVVREDGSLGGRLDPALSALLNYGSIYRLEAGNYTAEAGSADFREGTLSVSSGRVRLGTFHRTYTTFRMDLRESARAGVCMTQDGKRYEVVVEREGGRAYLKVLSPDDASHKVNSSIELPADTGVLDVKIVCDGEFIECFVNDTCALTAHTAMTGPSHELSLFADGEAAFREVNVSKLRPYGEIA